MLLFMESLQAVRELSETSNTITLVKSIIQRCAGLDERGIMINISCVAAPQEIKCNERANSEVISALQDLLLMDSVWASVGAYDPAEGYVVS